MDVPGDLLYYRSVAPLSLNGSACSITRTEDGGERVSHHAGVHEDKVRSTCHQKDGWLSSKTPSNEIFARVRERGKMTLDENKASDG
mmetsp:Transcript_24612/g.51081  ORF Transcript_24612/g.51081 Transcript_24612/m.51081 type:complete len:87 (+) Transcript_24612:122-382(+)